MLLRVIKDLFKTQAQEESEALEAVQTLVQAGQFQPAIEMLNLLSQRSPSNADLHLQLAQCYQKTANKDKALAHCEKARALNPESVGAYVLLSELCLPGEDYFALLSRIITHLKPRTYVEIGVFEGSSLRLAKTAKRVVGIDPAPKITWPLEPHMQVFKTTSDAFFAQNDLLAVLGDRRVDLAFIDGMHQFEFALRDFANLERCCHQKSVILVQACYPLDEESAGREPRDSRWSGDVWRLIALLKKHRPDLHIQTIGTAPTGLAVIQNLNPESRLLLDQHDTLVQEFLALDYAYLHDQKAEKLNLVPNHWPHIKASLKQRQR